MTATIRPATLQDAELLLTFIKELADYEKRLQDVTGTVEKINKTFFCENPKVEALIMEEEGTPVGFAVYFYHYSTFLCQHSLYIEDIYVRESARGKGYGKAFFNHLCRLAKEKDCGRVEWWCLDWNKPSIDFYHHLGAKAMSEWTVYRLEEKEIEKLAA